MTQPIPTIDYSSELPTRSDIVLRRIVGWLAIVFAVLRLISGTITLLTAKGVLGTAYPTFPALSVDEKITMTAGTLTCGAILIGGIRVLNRLSYGSLIIRICTLILILISLSYLSYDIITQVGKPGQYSSIPAAFYGIYAHISFNWPEISLFLLTLPSLAQRIK